MHIRIVKSHHGLWKAAVIVLVALIAPPMQALLAPLVVCLAIATIPCHIVGAKGLAHQLTKWGLVVFVVAIVAPFLREKLYRQLWADPESRLAVYLLLGAVVAVAMLMAIARASAKHAKPHS